MEIGSDNCSCPFFIYLGPGTMVFFSTVRKKCSRDWKKLLKFEAEGREFKKMLSSLKQFIQTVEGQNDVK
jgi:hypothetical protein